MEIEEQIKEAFNEIFFIFYKKKRKFLPLILNPNGIIALNQISHHLITKKSGLD